MSDETKSKGLEALTDRIYTDPAIKNVIYGETIHKQNDFFKQFAAPSHLDKLQSHHVDTIRMEMDADLQPHVDQLAKGEITKGDFTAIMKRDFKFFDMDESTAQERRDLIADMIVDSSARGIKIHFVDKLAGTEIMSDLKNDPKTSAHIEACKASTYAGYSEHDLSMMANDVRLRMAEKLGACASENQDVKTKILQFFETRTDNDRALGKAAGDDRRTAFFYGNMHGEGIAAGYPGKSAGIAGVYPGLTGVTQTLTPFFKYHYEVPSGTTTEPFKVDRQRAAMMMP